MHGRMGGDPQSAGVTGDASDEPSGSGGGAAYIAVTALSHLGAVRDQQEDSLVAGPWTLCATVTENPQTLVFPLGTPLVVAVADGLGGHPGGEVASALVVRRLALAGASLGSEDSVRETLRDCNRTVYAAAAGSPGLTAMGTTVAGIVLTAERVLAFNVGDSRVYAASGGGLRQLSTDDRPSGQGLPASIVTQTLGGHDEPTDIDPHLATSPLSPGHELPDLHRRPDRSRARQRARGGAGPASGRPGRVRAVEGGDRGRRPGQHHDGAGAPRFLGRRAFPPGLVSGPVTRRG